MLKRFSLVLAAGLTLYGCKTQKVATTPAAESSTSQKSKLKPYNKVITAEAESDNGLFTTHRLDDHLYFTIPDSLMEKDMLLVSRIAKVPAGYGGGYVNAGSKVNEQVIRWSRRGNFVDARVINFENQSDQDSPINKSVEANNFFPILFSAEIKALAKDSTGVVIDATDLFTQDITAINAVSPRLRKQYKVKRLDDKRSYIESAHAYPQNIEIKHVMTYDTEEPPERDQASTLTFLMNQSMILLPEDKMQPRIADERVGWFTLRKYDYDSDALKSDDYRILRRWRLVPKDIEAYKRGELVEPVKPIIYYLDPATPLKWRPYFKQGIEDWNAAFEKAGFKNAIIAKDPPSPEEDPEFSPEDVRYSVIRYVASTTRNAVGPSVSDPRTGEILESDVIWYHNHLRSYRNRFMIEAGAQNPAARTLETPEAEIGEMMRMVIAHEVGHAIGLPHNMKASSAYPTDSLRVASFTQKYGLTPSIMDYARVNYVAQPEDKGVRYIRMMGPYDYYAVNWGYRYIPEAETAEEEKPTLDQWILEKAGNPWYEFGSSTGVDPHSQTESLGDDNIKASLYGLANMKKVIPNLIDWTTKDGYGYDDLDEVYGELTRLWRGYVYHVITNVGGIYETRKTADQEGVVYEPVPKSIQEEAVTFLNEHAFTTPEWLLDKEILNRIESDGAIERIQNLQTRALNSLLSVDRINRLVSTVEQEGAEAYSPIELMTDLRKGIFSELYAAQKTDAYRRNLQRAFIDIASEYIKKEKADDDEVLKSDASALMRGVLNQMRRDLNTRKNYSGDTITQYHFEDLIARIDTAFDRD
ncbi:MAG TPA: zinc-dependent metalloprotease [Leeuwenhoekiella sp.]|nr:zinc-dependent metalloprotease [Leeuwenhoekiella sp.]HAX14438.1 zinc-dependent metalloprotease [Leeuwenhoekiella sp.]HBO29327.1 zinc-dependent metalloprotease [Leeuwenhoekiella sp.]HCQ77216.1 zinc-dependent metalloprotease [Leeuwenhoekiella sp.]|tara:strand:+ start:1046 stop:3478 length:2433 start_codon:yes stop_codon:yes gene_type:complete